jgi:hypothetical protein
MCQSRLQFYAHTHPNLITKSDTTSQCVLPLMPPSQVYVWGQEDGQTRVSALEPTHELRLASARQHGAHVVYVCMWETSGPLSGTALNPNSTRRHAVAFRVRDGFPSRHYQPGLRARASGPEPGFPCKFPVLAFQVSFPSPLSKVNIFRVGALSFELRTAQGGTPDSDWLTRMD